MDNLFEKWKSSNSKCLDVKCLEKKLQTKTNIWSFDYTMACAYYISINLLIAKKQKEKEINWIGSQSHRQQFYYYMQSDEGWRMKESALPYLTAMITQYK